MQPPPKKLLDQVRDAIRLEHYPYRTEETWIAENLCRKEAFSAGVMKDQVRVLFALC